MNDAAKITKALGGQNVGGCWTGRIMTGGQSKDRAAVVATAIIQIVIAALRGWLDGEAPDAFLAARPAIEAILRQEFFENTREARDEIPPPD